MDIIWKGRNGFSDGLAESWRPMLRALMSSRREQLAAGGCGDQLRLNQLHLPVHNVDYLICYLEVRAGARSQEDGIPPSTSKIPYLFLSPKSSMFLMHLDVPSRDNHP